MTELVIEENPLVGIFGEGALKVSLLKQNGLWTGSYDLNNSRSFTRLVLDEKGRMTVAASDTAGHFNDTMTLPASKMVHAAWGGQSSVVNAEFRSIVRPGDVIQILGGEYSSRIQRMGIGIEGAQNCATINWGRQENDLQSSLSPGLLVELGTQVLAANMIGRFNHHNQLYPIVKKVGSIRIISEPEGDIFIYPNTFQTKGGMNERIGSGSVQIKDMDGNFVAVLSNIEFTFATKRQIEIFTNHLMYL